MTRSPSPRQPNRTLVSPNLDLPAPAPTGAAVWPVPMPGQPSSRRTGTFHTRVSEQRAGHRAADVCSRRTNRLRPPVAPRIRLQVMLSATILQRCSSSPKKRLRRSAPLTIRVGNSPPRSSCAGVSPASPTPRRRGNVPGRSPDGSRCPCRPVRRRDCAGDHARSDVGVVARSVSFRSFNPSGGRIASNRTPASVAILCSLAA